MEFLPPLPEEDAEEESVGDCGKGKEVERGEGDRGEGGEGGKTKNEPEEE